MAKFSVILDANVLYPAPLRDLLMRLSLTDLFKARWTDRIHEEWINALMRKPDCPFKKEQLERTRDLMDQNVRDAKVYGYEDLIEGIKGMPDHDDRHVLAAAIRCNADAIVTFNIKDFPQVVLDKYDVEIIHPDDFIYYQLELDPVTVCRVVKEQRLNLTNPKKTAEDLLATLLRQQLPTFVEALRENIDLI